MQAFLLVLFLFLTFCLVVAGVERVAFKLKSMLVGLVGRQTFNTFVIALILIYSGCGAYKSATTVQHPFTVLFLGASHTTTDTSELLWNWCIMAAFIFLHCFWAGVFSQPEEEAEQRLSLFLPACLVLGPWVWKVAFCGAGSLPKLVKHDSFDNLLVEAALCG